jgi:hypothetical protein
VTTVPFDFDLISRYALTFNGYQEFEEFESVAELANARLEEYGRTGTWRGTLRELRGCLFFEQRRWRHFGWAPEGDDLEAIQDLFRAIMNRLAAGERVPNSSYEEGWLDEWSVVVQGRSGKLISDPQVTTGPYFVTIDESGEIITTLTDPRCTEASHD